MKNKIKNFKSIAKKLNLPMKELLIIENIFFEVGGKIRIVGGNVRDLILGRKMSSPTDLASDLNPDQMIDCLKKSDIRYLKTGYKYGTITIVINEVYIEVTSLRKDLSTDGRWAEVKFTKDWLEDARRRDLTVNSIYCDLKGNIFDYFGGKDDLINGRVIFVGEPLKRIKEDYLRILRFLRFSIKYSKSFDHKSLLACSAMKKKIPLLSFERRIMEFKKILMTTGFNEKFNELDRTKILDYVFMSKINSIHISRLFKIEKEIKDEDFERRIKFLFRNKKVFLKKSDFHKLGKKSFSRIIDRLKLDDFGENEIYKNLFLYGKTLVIDEIIFNHVDGNITLRKFNKLYNIINSWKHKRNPISGEDIKQLGVKEGKLIGKYLKDVLNWWIKKNFRPGKTECIEYLQKVTKKQLAAKT
jgi:poly(A) polymerase